MSSVRKIQPNGRSITGFYISRNGTKLEIESKLERDCYLLLDYSPSIASIRAQPLRIGRHVPDCLVETISGELLMVNIKFESELVERWDELSEMLSSSWEYCKANGFHYGFMTDISIRKQRRMLSILEQITYIARGGTIASSEFDSQIIAFLEKEGNVTVGNLAERLDSALDHPSRIAAICRSIFSGKIILCEREADRIEDAVIEIPRNLVNERSLSAIFVEYQRMVQRIKDHPFRSLAKGITVVEEGRKLQIGDDVYEVVDDSHRENVEVRNMRTREDYCLDMLNVHVQDICKENSATGEQPMQATSLLTTQREHPQRYESAKKKYEVISPLISQHQQKIAVRDVDVDMIAGKSGVSSSSIRRWIRLYKNEGFAGLVTSGQIGGKGKRRIDSQTEKIITTVIDQEYLTNQRKKPAEIFRLVLAECYKTGTRPPSAMTVYDRIHKCDPRSTMQMRFGARKAAEIYNLVGGRFEEKQFPLQTVQIDHTKLDVRVLDELTGEVVSRPWLTIALDVFSRCVWAYYLGFDQPNDDIVGLTILMGVQKKDNYVQRYGLSEWPVFSRPLQVHTDNGKDFRSKLMDAGCEENGISVLRRPVKTPRYGGYIERFFKTLEEKFIHNLPGTTFSSPRERLDYDSDKEAMLTISDLERMLLQFIVNEYHNTVHTELRMTPLEMWKEGVKTSSIQPNEPADLNRFRLDFLSFVEPDGMRTIQRDGMHFRDLAYFHPILNVLPHFEEDGRTPKKYYTRYDPFDMRYLHVLDAREGRKQYHTLLLRDCPSEPFSLRELEAGRKGLRSRGNRSPSESLVLETILNRREQLKELASASKNVRKTMAARRREQEASKMIVKEKLVQPETKDEKLVRGEYVPSFNVGELAKKIRLPIPMESGSDLE